jgi:hypothetical protein
MSYGKIDPKLEAAHVSREEILARLDRLEAEIDAALADLAHERKRERQQRAERAIKWWITPLT